eukprot:757387-Prorocentrum_minimum.AAC.1
MPNCVEIPHVWVFTHGADVEPIALKCIQTAGLVLAKPVGRFPNFARVHLQLQEPCSQDLFQA